MPAYNFQKQFSDLVEKGLKLQTIRKTRKRAKVGDTAYLYTGQRTSECRKLGEGIITEIYPIAIDWTITHDEPYVVIYFNYFNTLDDRPGSDHLYRKNLDDFAKLDGFNNGRAMVEWFDKQYGLPFTGFLHQWVLKK